MNLKIQISTIQILNHISEFQNLEEKKLRIKKKMSFLKFRIKTFSIEIVHLTGWPKIWLCFRSSVPSFREIRGVKNCTTGRIFLVTSKKLKYETILKYELVIPKNF